MRPDVAGIRAAAPRRRLVTASCIAVLFVLAPKAAAAEDSWFGRDKSLHFAVSAGVAGAGYAGASLLFDERWQRATTGAALAIAAGAAKEIHDATGAGHPSWKDFTWDVAGSVVGASVAWLIDLALSGDPAPPEPAGAMAPPAGTLMVFHF